MASDQGGLSWWPLILVVSPQVGLIRVASDQGGLPAGWSPSRVASHQGGFIWVVSHLGGPSSGWSVI